MFLLKHCPMTSEIRPRNSEAQILSILMNKLLCSENIGHKSIGTRVINLNEIF
jgi:hypothetical protein